jgi:subtilase family serine protease
MKRNRYPKENYKMNHGKCWTAMSKGLAVAAVTMGLAAGSLANQGPRVLITTPINEAQLVTLVGNTRFDANAHTDRGRVADRFELQHMLLQLRRPAELEDAFAKYIETQTDKSSPNFRRWMSAKEQGETFGLAQQDIDTITDWLRSKGFAVGHVYPSRMVIDFSGTAGQIRDAFHTEIHNLDVHGEQHYANMSDPQIPAALAPAVVGVVSMHNFKPHANHELHSDFTMGDGTFTLVPADFQTIYNVTPLYREGITGKGQTVALVEDSDSFGTDWASYQSTFGLTSFKGTFSTVHPNSAGNCTDPGTTGDDLEADLDVEMVTAVAPAANVELISCSDTATFGGLLAVQNIVSAGNPPAVMSMSFGVCEVLNGAASNVAFYSAFQSAAAAGVSVFVSAGDSGPSSCARDFQEAVWALPGIGVTGWGETPYNVSVGGTDFEDLYNALEGGLPQSTYWSATNSPTFGSALSYIPEIPWNDSCASYLLYHSKGFGTPYGSAGFCNSSAGSEFLNPTGGGGGPSNCAKGSGSEFGFTENSTCRGYVKPSWQKILGNPVDETRDVPDVSLFASNGIWSHFITICYSDTQFGGKPCTGSPANWIGVGGTSASSPLMAAFQALVNEKWNVRVGNPNPIYYSIAAAEFGEKGNSACYSINETAGNSCVFNDITQGDTSLDCFPNTDVYRADCFFGADHGGVGALSTQAIKRVTVTAGGSGYSSAPKCTIAEPSNNSPYFSPEGVPIYSGGKRTTCTATVTSGSVTGVTVMSPGKGYTGNPICTLSGGGGKDAKCQAIITPTVAANSYQPAYGATPGWDFATGLGSVNAYNLVNNSAW